MGKVARWWTSMGPIVPSGNPGLTGRLIKFCCILCFGWFPGVWILCADVSEHCLFHLHRSCEQEENILVHTTSLVGTEYSETSADRIQTLWNCPNERMQHSQQGESMKSRNIKVCRWLFITYLLIFALTFYYVSIDSCADFLLRIYWFLRWLFITHLLIFALTFYCVSIDFCADFLLRIYRICADFLLCVYWFLRWLFTTYLLIFALAFYYVSIDSCADFLLRIYWFLRWLFITRLLIFIQISICVDHILL